MIPIYFYVQIKARNLTQTIMHKQPFLLCWQGTRIINYLPDTRYANIVIFQRHTIFILQFCILLDFLRSFFTIVRIFFLKIHFRQNSKFYIFYIFDFFKPFFYTFVFIILLIIYLFLFILLYILIYYYIFIKAPLLHNLYTFM